MKTWLTHSICGLLMVCVLIGAALSQEPRPTVTVGSKKFTENVILGEIVRHLGKQVGVQVNHRQQLGGTRFLWSALTNDEIQVYPEYTGTLRKEIFADRLLEDQSDLMKAVQPYDLTLTRPLGFSNTYALAMRRDRAKQLGIRTISDLRDHPDLTLGFTNEFMDREDGWPGLQNAYNLPHGNVQGLSHNLAYQGVASDDVDVIDAYTTDSKIQYHDLRLLEDDRNYFPTYHALYVYRSELKKNAPELVRIIKKLEGQISQAEMTAMNADVQLEGHSAERVAANFLKREFGFSVTVRTKSNWINLIKRTREHLFLVLVSLIAAILLAIPLGIAAAYWTTPGQLILGSVGILQTIPSIALLVFMIPPFGIGTTPAMAALFLYSLLPIVRNTYSGLQSIPRDILESATALGLPERTILVKVKLPLAARSILAGIKTSAVINVGVATLGALIGAGGYGQPIFTGIRLDDMELILQGAIPAAFLALLVQGLFDLAERFLVSEGLRDG